MSKRWWPGEAMSAGDTGVSRRSRRLATVLRVGIVAVVGLTVVLVAVGVWARVDTSDKQARAEPLKRERHALETREREDVYRLGTLRRSTNDVTSWLSALLGAIRAQVKTANRAAGVANNAA